MKSFHYLCNMEKFKPQARYYNPSKFGISVFIAISEDALIRQTNDPNDEPKDFGTLLVLQDDFKNWIEREEYINSGRHPFLEPLGKNPNVKAEHYSTTETGY